MSFWLWDPAGGRYQPQWWLVLLITSIATQFLKSIQYQNGRKKRGGRCRKLPFLENLFWLKIRIAIGYVWGQDNYIDQGGFLIFLASYTVSYLHKCGCLHARESLMGWGWLGGLVGVVVTLSVVVPFEALSTLKWTFNTLLKLCLILLYLEYICC